MKTNFDNKDEKCLRLGLLGCGMINQSAHFISCMKGRNLVLQALCDVSEELRSKMAAMYEPVSVYSDYADMLADPDVDAVVIGIGDQFHVPCAKQAILAGKHVFLEKPMGVSTEECEDLKALADEKGLMIQIGHMKRFDPGLQFGKQFMEEKCGEPVTFKAWYCDSVGRYVQTDNWQPVIYSSSAAKKPAGNPKAVLDHYYLLGHGSHLFDTTVYFMGKIKRISARYVHKDEKKIHSWLIDCDFENGAIGTLDLSIAIAHDWHEGLELYGTDGTVFAKIYNPWEFRGAEVECYDRATDVISKPAAYDGQTYRRELEAFADSILNGKPCAGTTAEEGIHVMKCLMATYRSVHSDGAWIDVEDCTGEL